MEIIYQTFVRSKMEYACIVWDDSSEQNCQVLENCQLRAARIITGAKKGTSHNKLYPETQWPELEERRAYFKLCFMHKVVHKSASDYLVDVNVFKNLIYHQKILTKIAVFKEMPTNNGYIMKM